MSGRDAIVSVATPWGRSALAIVRMSGADLAPVLGRWLRPRGGTALSPGRPRRVDVVDGRGHVVDDGVLVWLDHERTATGEPTAELTVHGNPALLEAVLDAARDAGARLARPGEFTRRAVLHGKLDLLQAEAVSQVIHAPTAAGARLARQGLEGTLSSEMVGIRDDLVTVAAELEARLDHPDDELALESDAELVARLLAAAERARDLAGTYAAGRVLVHGARVALVGAVNAGKSSLFNALLGRPRALVHDQPGTTRDVVEVQTQLGGLALTLLDTAGERVTTDPVEAAGLALARELVDEADLLLVVLRARPSGPSDAERQILDRTRHRARLLVLNGVDRPHASVPDALPTVAPTGQGLPELVGAIRRALLQDDPADGDLLIASARQRDRLAELASLAHEATLALPDAGVAVAAELTLAAIEQVDALTGADTREDVLDAIFARFCIGK